jgi:preprotein translocase subunit SecA
MLKALTKIFGTKTERELKNLWPIAEEINSIYEKLQGVDLLKQTEDFKKRISQGEPLDDILPEAKHLPQSKRHAEDFLEKNGLWLI